MSGLDIYPLPCHISPSHTCLQGLSYSSQNSTGPNTGQVLSQRCLNHCPITPPPHPLRDLYFSHIHTDTCILIGFPRSGKSLVCDHRRIPLQELRAMGVWRICERRRQTSCRIGFTSENGGGNSTTGKKNNHRRTKTQKCSQASFSFLSQGLEIYSTMCWKIGTIGSEICLLSLRGFMFSRGQRHKCPSCRLRFSLTACVVSSACAKNCYCGCIVGISRLCPPKGQCSGLRFSYSDP